jgi:hypothetical protein
MLSSLIFITASFFSDQSAWPGFLGAGASEIDPATIPLKWSPTENVAWDASLPGHGQSSPVIWGEKVFVTTVEGDNKETCHTVCLSLKDGSILWDHKHTSTAPDPNSVYISRAAPTPVVDEVVIEGIREIHQQVRPEQFAGTDRVFSDRADRR